MKFDIFKELTECHRIRAPKGTDVWAIGDVHGCLDEYLALYDLISTTSKSDFVIVQLGDMIDRGPEFVDLILSDFADYRIMGNHEYNFVQEYLGRKPCRSKARQRNIDDLKSRDQRQQDYVMRCLSERVSYLTYELNGRLFVLSHAPFSQLHRGWDEVRALGTTSIGDWAMYAQAVDMDRIRQLEQDVTYIHGHQSWNYKDVEDQINDQKDQRTRIINLDSGCVYGGELIAYRLNDNRVVRVKSSVNVNVDSERHDHV